MDTRTKLAPPWTIYAKRIEALFAADADVEFEFIGYEVTLRVKGGDKAEAMERILPSEIPLGNVTLKVRVVPDNGEPTEAETIRRAFAGNPILADVAEGYGPAQDVSYAMFAPEVVQLREDDISKFDGLTTLTCEELAQSVLKVEEVRICSAPKA